MDRGDLQLRVRDVAGIIAAMETRGAASIGGMTVENPAFDVTPRHPDAVVTDRGQLPPESIVTLVRGLFREGPTAPRREP